MSKVVYLNLAGQTTCTFKVEDLYIVVDVGPAQPGHSGPFGLEKDVVLVDGQVSGEAKPAVFHTPSSIELPVAEYIRLAASSGNASRSEETEGKAFEAGA